jgi:hypothetical protein
MYLQEEIIGNYTEMLVERIEPHITSLFKDYPNLPVM